MKKLLTSLFLLFSLFVFTQEYHFDYKLSYKSASKERENTFTQLVNSKNPNIYVFFFTNQNDVYARLLDYDKNIGHTFLVKENNGDSEFIYNESNKLSTNNCVVKNVITEKLFNEEYDYKISFDYKYKFSSKKKITFKIKLKEFENNLILNYPMDFGIQNKKEIFSKLLYFEKGNYIIDKSIYDSPFLKNTSVIERLDLVIILPKKLNYIN